MSTETTREALAELLAGHRYEGREAHVACSCEWEWRKPSSGIDTFGSASNAHIADAILASPWLAAHVAAVVAETRADIATWVETARVGDDLAFLEGGRIAASIRAGGDEGGAEAERNLLDEARATIDRQRIAIEQLSADLAVVRGHRADYLALAREATGKANTALSALAAVAALVEAARQRSMRGEIGSVSDLGLSILDAIAPVSGAVAKHEQEVRADELRRAADEMDREGGWESPQPWLRDRADSLVARKTGADS